MDGKVTFTWSKPRSKRKRRLTLDSHEFIRRYLQHVLPRRFVKVRYYGFMHPCSSHSKTVRSLIELSLGFEVEQVETETETKPIDHKACPLCGGKLEFLFVIYSDSMEKGVDTSWNIQIYFKEHIHNDLFQKKDMKRHGTIGPIHRISTVDHDLITVEIPTLGKKR